MNLIDRVMAATIPGLTPTDSQLSTQGLFDKVFYWATTIAGALAVIYLIYNGILYITSAGNAEQAKKAQQGVLNAVIGVIIIMLAYAIINFATNFASGQ